MSGKIELTQYEQSNPTRFRTAFILGTTKHPTLDGVVNLHLTSGQVIPVAGDIDEIDEAIDANP